MISLRHGVPQPGREPSGGEVRSYWLLEPDVAFLNHGSFGACPGVVLEAQRRLREQMEREPVRFFVRELEPLVAAVRERVAGFVGAAPDDVVFVRNTTEAANSVLRSLRLNPGEQILVTDHGYGAVTNAARWVCERWGAELVTARLPFPIDDQQAAVQAVAAATNERTRLAIIDHVTSPTGLVLPIEPIARALARGGIDCFIDGAHGPGMLPLDLAALGRAGVGYYAGNFHKWVCAPKGAAMLWARRDRQAGLLPTVISHGYSSRRPRSRFLETFDWTGTDDPTPLLCVPAALDFVEQELGGWPALRARAHALLLEGRNLLCTALGCAPPAPDDMLGLLAALPLPDGSSEPPPSALYLDELQLRLYQRHRIEVPVVPWPSPPKRLVRISAHAYNALPEYQRLGAALRVEQGDALGGGTVANRG